MNTAVVGAGGFIGGHLCRALTRLGGLPVEVRHHDDGAVLRNADVVFYAAGSITPALAASEPERIGLDAAALAAALDECGRGGRRPTFVLLSSGGTVYRAAAEPPYDETSPVGPTGEYGRAKLASERAVLAASDVVRPLILRLSNVYGPGQRARGGLGVVPHWLEAAAAGEPLHVFGDPAARRDYVYVGDVTTALLNVWRRQHDDRARTALDGRVLNLGAGRPTSLDELLAVVTATVAHAPAVIRSARRAFDRRDVWLDVRRAGQVLGWRPVTSLPTGVGRTWAALITRQSGSLLEVAHPAQR